MLIFWLTKLKFFRRCFCFRHVYVKEREPREIIVFVKRGYGIRAVVKNKQLDFCFGIIYPDPVKRINKIFIPVRIFAEYFLLFKNYIMEKSGIVVPPEKSYLIETRLARLMAEAGADSFSEFYYYNL